MDLGVEEEEFEHLPIHVFRNTSVVAKERVIKLNLPPGRDQLVARNRSTVKFPKFTGPPSKQVAELRLIRAEEDNKADNRQGDDNHPKPLLMLSNRAKHKLRSIKTELPK